MSQRLLSISLNGPIWILTFEKDRIIRIENIDILSLAFSFLFFWAASWLVKDIGIPWLSVLHLAASRGSSFLVQSPSLFIFHHMALLMMQSLINHNTISWANQLNTNSTYQTTLSLFARLFNCKIFTWALWKKITKPLCFGINL
mgnify:CR=1 FL=1